jgi:hypothetical protein
VLFKTRVGLCVLNENVEIRVFPPMGSKDIWGILAQYRGGPEFESKSTFGKSFKFDGVWFYLAIFLPHEDVEVEIGKAMQLIADAYSSSATFCDLSQVGSSEAWRRASEKWATVRWP